MVPKDIQVKFTTGSMLSFAAFLIFLFSVSISAQSTQSAIDWEAGILVGDDLARKEIISQLTKYDFGPLWTGHDNSAVFGFIGHDYQRLRIKIISARKDSLRPDTYIVVGKSKVKENVLPFTGFISITKARLLNDPQTAAGQEHAGLGIKSRGIVMGEFKFAEDRKQNSSGTFEGRLMTAWYIDKQGKLKYDDLERDFDGFKNNQFVGTWKSYQTGVTKISNWGDYRIPLSGDLDGGAGEFSPLDRYLANGWQPYRDAYFENNKQARREETRKWWK